LNISGDIFGLISTGTFGAGNGGTLTIDVDRLLISGGGQLSSDSRSSGKGGNIVVRASDYVEAVGTFMDGGALSGLRADAINSGDAGNIFITSPALIVRDKALIASQVQQGSSGNGGNVILQTDRLLLKNGGQITAGTFGTGRGGALIAHASDSIKILGTDGGGSPSGLLTATYGGNDAGNIKVTTNQLLIQDGGTISASSLAFSGEGRGGNITINAPQFVEIIGGFTNADGNVFSSSLVAETGKLLEVPIGIVPAPGGSLTIKTGRLSIRDGGKVSTNTYNLAGRAGNLVVNASEAVEVSGNKSGLSAKTNGIGNAGDLTINTGQLSIRGGAEVSTSTSRDNDSLVVRQGGKAGILNVKADVVEISDVESGLISSSLLSTGDAGQINLNTRRLIISEGGTVSTSSVLGGRGGDLNVTATESIFITGQGITSLINDPFGVGKFKIASNLSTDAASFTDAGNLFVNTNRLIVQDSGEISARTRGLGNAGNIEIQSNSIALLNGGLLTSQSSGRGNAGNVLLIAQGLLQANDGTISTAATRSSGGQIDIMANDIRLRGNSDIKTFVGNGEGGGGNITLAARSILAFNDSDILAFSKNGPGGDVTLNTRAFFGQNYHPASRGTDPATLDRNNRVDINASGTISGTITLPDTTFIQNSLSQLPNNQIDTNKLLAQTCIVRKDQPEGTFYITGTGGIPNRPNDPALSDYPTNTIQPTTQTAQRPWKLGDPIVEPQGFYQLANGRLVMSRECP
jgi:large exoprotein involved in heme utilization and adhesion